MEIKVYPEILELAPQLSPGVQAEADAFAEMRAVADDFAKTATPQEYWMTGGSLAPYQYQSVFAALPRGSKVLDVGVGFGPSSVYLANCGHEVVAIEPSIVLCRVLRDAAVRFSLNLQVIQGVGEKLSLLGRNDFDVVVFNSSLHHCDDPELALREARACLKPSGALYLVNENMLKPWQTQAGYLRRLAADPIGMGHYGGNEHSYHNGTYVKMLRTVFRDVTLEIPRAGTAIEDLEMLLARRVNGVRIYGSNGKILARYLFYIVREQMRHMPWLYRLLAKASIVPVHFKAAGFL